MGCALGAAYGGEPAAQRQSEGLNQLGGYTAREAKPREYMGQVPVNRRFTTVCCAKGALMCLRQGHTIWTLYPALNFGSVLAVLFFAMDFISTLAIGMGASWVSGINLYATVATLGLLGRFANLKLPGELEVLTSWWIIGVALFLFVVEFFADKIPVVDSTWDVIHTFIRIPAGAVLAATAFGSFDRNVQVIAFLVGGGLALSSHGTKAATRLLINTSPEPASNIVASVLEDVLAIGSILLAAFLPVAFFLVIAAGLVLSFWLLPRVLKFFRNVFRKVLSFRRGSFSSAIS
jgi:hypothetical protein